MRKLLPRLFALLAVPVLAQCGSAAIVQEAISDGVPAVVFPALCAVFAEEEGFDALAISTVLRETRPVFSTFALRILHQAGEMTPAEAEQDDARDEALKARFVSTRIELPEDCGSCRWRLADQPAKDYFGTKTLILELSNVVEDPFASADEARYGLFARESLGGASGGSWYWVALRQAGASWEVAAVSQLEISDG